MRRNVRVELQTKKQMSDWDKEQEQWEHVAWAWISRRPLKGREFVDTRQVHSEVTHKLEMEYMPQVSPRMRAVATDGTVLNFVEVIDVMDRHRTLEIMAQEVV